MFEWPLTEIRSQHRVRVNKSVYLGKYEVTQGEFRKFVKVAAIAKRLLRRITLGEPV